MLPLMYILDISDIIIMFAIKSLKSPTNAFSTTDHVTFASGNTHLGSSNKQEVLLSPAAISSLIDFLVYGMLCQ